MGLVNAASRELAEHLTPVLNQIADRVVTAVTAEAELLVSKLAQDFKDYRLSITVSLERK